MCGQEKKWTKRSDVCFIAQQEGCYRMLIIKHKQDRRTNKKREIHCGISRVSK